MGVSTDAMLFYGILLEESADIHPKILDGKGVDPRGWCKYGTDEFVASPDCELVMHNHCEYPMYALALSSTFKKAYRGEPATLNPKFFTLPENADVSLRAYCDELGVEYSQPQWYIASYWG